MSVYRETTTSVPSRIGLRIAGPLLVVTLGTLGWGGSSHPASAHASPPLDDEPPIAEREANQKNFEAMVSILAQAFWSGTPPARLKALPVEQALKRLMDPSALSWDRTAVSRRRRGIATLMAYGMGVPRIEAALREAGVPIDSITARVREQEHLLGGLLSANASARETFIADLPELRQGQFASTADTASTGSNCWTKFSTRVYPDRQINIVVDIEAANTLARIAMGLDPQSWDQCGTAWKTGSGTYFAHLDNAGHVVQDVEINPHGQAFTSRSLYENFVCQVGFCGSKFELLLGVNATSTVDLYHVNYWLTPQGDYPKGTVSGVPQKLLIDDGHLEAKAIAADLARVHGQKRIAFESDSTTTTVGAILQQIELASELGELACCFTQ